MNGQYTVGAVFNPTEVFFTYDGGDERRSCVAFRVYDWTGKGEESRLIRRRNAHALALRIAAFLNGDDKT